MAEWLSDRQLTPSCDQQKELWSQDPIHKGETRKRRVSKIFFQVPEDLLALDLIYKITTLGAWEWALNYH